MARGKRFSAEQIVTKLRRIEVQTAQGNSLALACKQAGISEQSRDRHLQGPRQSYPPHSALGYRPPAPVTLEAIANRLPMPTTLQSSH